MSTAQQHPGIDTADGASAPSEDALAAEVVLALHRLTKGATLYAPDNQATLQQQQKTRSAVVEYGRHVHLNPQVFFTKKAVFVGGRMLRAGRAAYTAGLELGKILRRFSVDEIAIGYDVTTDDLRALQDAMRAALQGTGTSPADQTYQRIRLRRGQPPGRRDDDLNSQEKIIRAFASATVVMRRFLEAIQAGQYRLPVAVRRVAQQLAQISATNSPAFLGATAVYNAQHDHAGRAVNAALVALSMARQLTDNRRLLARLAMGALLHDVGVARVAGSGPTGEGRAGLAMPKLIDEQLSELPASSAAAMWALGGFGVAARQHTVLVYESLTVAHRQHAAPAYGGHRQPSLGARIIATARRFNDLLADADHERSANDALCMLISNASEEIEQTVVRLLMSALGLFTTGSVVKLSTGEVAQVVRASDNPLLFSLPTVRVVLTAGGAQPPHRRELDLAQLGQPGLPHITELVELGHEVPPSIRQAPIAARQESPRSAHAAHSAHAAQSDHTERSAQTERSGYSPNYAMPARPAPPAPAVARPAPSGPRRASAASMPSARRSQGSAIAQSPSRARRPSAVSAEGAAPGEVPQTALFDHTEALDAATKAAAALDSELKGLDWVMDAETVSEDDDVPSLLLQAIVDGRAGAESASEASPLAALFPNNEQPETQSAATGSEQAGSTRSAARLSATAAAHQALDAYGSSARPSPADSHAAQPAEVAGRDRAGQLPSTPAPQGAGLEQQLAAQLATLRPTAQGAFERTPLVHLLVYALDQRLSGTTVLVDNAGQPHVILMKEGVPCKVRTAGVVSPLDQVLVELGLLDEATLKRTLQGALSAGELHGRFLVRQGKLSVSAITAALQWQLVRKMGYLLSLGADTRYAYYDGIDLLEGHGGPEHTPADPLSLIMAGVRMMSDRPIVNQTLQRLGQFPLRIRREANVRRLAFKDQERNVLDLLRARPMDLSSVLQKNVTHPRLAELTIYGLVITRCLKLGDNQRAPVGHDQPVIELTWPQVVRASSTEASSADQQARQRTSSAAQHVSPKRAAAPQNAPGMPSSRPPGPRPAGQRQGPSSHQHTPLPRRGTSSMRGSALADAGQPASRQAAAQPSRSQPAQAARPAPPTSPRAEQRGVVQRSQATTPQRTGRAPSGSDARPTAASRPRAAGGDRKEPPQAAATASPGSGLTRAEITERASGIDDQTLFAILGVGINAPPKELQNAYFAQAKAWHPDRLPEELADLRAEVAKVFARLNDAHQLLRDPQKRADYTEVVKQGGGTAKDNDKLERLVDSALLFQKAEVFFKKGNLGSAEGLVMKAVKADPDQPEYRALLAWIQATQLGTPEVLAQGQTSDRYAPFIASLTAIIEAENDFSRAIFYRAELLKRSGYRAEALQDYRRVAELDPRNIDAAREVRLHKRRQARDNPSADGSLLGRFFGKKRSGD